MGLEVGFSCSNILKITKGGLDLNPRATKMSPVLAK